VIHSEILEAILRVPSVLFEYQTWLAESSAAVNDDYLFYQSKVRFEPHDADRLAVPNTLVVLSLGKDAGVQISEHLPAIRIPSIPRKLVDQVIAALREQPHYVELPLISGVTISQIEQVLRVGFGRFIFAPGALQDLETQACAAEIVRFPSSPYEIVRNYWQNLGVLCTEVKRAGNTSLDASAFTTWLRGMHAMLLLGGDLCTFYCPASPIARRRAAPGTLYHHSTETVSTNLGTFIVKGLRIKVSQVGGERYHAIVHQSLEARTPELNWHQIADKGIPWGSIISARSRSEITACDWFLPPRPMLDTHWDELQSAWAKAVDATTGADEVTCVQQLARFHWCFVHLHPFACANQSLAFGLVNSLLNQVKSCGIPHLVLDHMALRLDCESYIRLFARAVAVWTTTKSDTQVRHKDRMQKRQALDAFVTRLDNAKDDASARAIVEEDSQGAQLALLIDS
jgi:hypothetical protein